jgi:hypothetical protein
MITRNLISIFEWISQYYFKVKNPYPSPVTTVTNPPHVVESITIAPRKAMTIQYQNTRHVPKTSNGIKGL